MALNQLERRILMTARARIATGEDHRICYAISNATTGLLSALPSCRFVEIREASNRLRTFIMGAIEDRFGLEDWLRAHAFHDVAGDKVKQRKARIQWLDWLLDEPWTEFNGGMQPLLDGEKVIVRLRNGEERGQDGSRIAMHGRWCHAAGPIFDAWAKDYDVVAYKVIYEAPTC
jgi:hypothetical protein